ncbi:MAG: fumarylacetoacetate hydrolase family protein [Geminicoccaceae bacterium]|nr:fumarylacetoacetate hydrolase family protein [Geminicoccaceae bacterium]
MDQVARIVANRLNGTRLARLSGLDENEGYVLQQDVNRALSATLGRRAGYKIGGTTAAMRQLLQIERPIAGEIFARTVHANGAHLPLAQFVRPGVETEIAVRLARTIEPSDAPRDPHEWAGHVDAVMPAIEIVDDRYEDVVRAGAATLAADNNCNAGSVLGEARTDWRDLPLDRLTARTFVDGQLRAEAVSSELMGHPLRALAWLVERYGRLGRTLEAGCFVSLGTITPVQWIESPAEIRIEIESLGAVSLSLT